MILEQIISGFWQGIGQTLAFLLVSFLVYVGGIRFLIKKVATVSMILFVLEKLREAKSGK